MSVLLLSFYLFILDRQIRCNDLDYFITIPKGSSATYVGIILKENELVSIKTSNKCELIQLKSQLLDLNNYIEKEKNLKLIRVP